MSDSRDVRQHLAAAVALAGVVALAGCMSPRHRRYTSHLTHAVESGELSESAEIAHGRSDAEMESSVAAVDSDE